MTTLVIGVLLVMSLILVVTTVVPQVDVTLLALVLAVLLVAVLAVVAVAVAWRRPAAAPAAPRAAGLSRRAGVCRPWRCWADRSGREGASLP